ncbi:hypothetical protein DVDV_1614 [Desulfovibrio sp. DV]|nr:hypothetical protein DVDV_1614 [Desulfovibrio sp. DV]
MRIRSNNRWLGVILSSLATVSLPLQCTIARVSAATAQPNRLREAGTNT